MNRRARARRRADCAWDRSAGSPWFRPCRARPYWSRPGTVRPPVRDALSRAVGTRAELKEVLSIPPIRFQSVDGLPTAVVSFTTDVPVFGSSWGEPLLLGPGTIHLAHTAEERVPKRQLSEAAAVYANMVKSLLARVQGG